MSILNIPSSKNESWHYTSAKKFLDKKRTWVLEKKHSIINHAPLEYICEDFLNLTFVNGRFSADLSSLSELHQSYSSSIEIKFFDEENIVSKAAVASFDSELFENLYHKNQRFGLSVKIKKNQKIDKPIQVISFITDDLVEAPVMLEVVLEVGSELELIETYSGRGSNYLQNSFTEIKLHESAKLLHVRLQKENLNSAHYGKTKLEVLNSAQYISAVFNIGSQLSKLDLRANMSQSNALGRFFGLALGVEDQHHDFYSEIFHLAGECTTQQLYKSILDQKSRSIFTGKVLIDRNSQNANSDQLNKNLLLSDHAESDSRPQLEIFADNVKATHGSTVGQLNPDEVFYLQSRGISKETAQNILCQGFADEILYSVENIKIRSYLKERIYGKP